MALLQILILLSSEYNLFLTVAHLNHGIRGQESDIEEEFVCSFCKEKGISFRGRRVDLHALRRKNRGKKSLEDIGREERYRFFASLASEIGASKIALGHHREDQAETVLMNLLRGSGMEGIKGMLPVREMCYIRPLLEISRKDIHKFLSSRNIPFLEDSSNNENMYLRNKIRHHLIPILQEQYNPQIVDSLNRIARILQREDKYLRDNVYVILQDLKLFPSSKNGEIEIELDKVLELPEAIKFRLIKTLLERYFLSAKRITSKHINSVMNLITGMKPHGSIILPEDICVRRVYGRITIKKNNRTKFSKGSFAIEKYDVEKYFYPVRIPCVIEIKEISCILKTSFVEDVSEFHAHDLSKEGNYTYFDYNKAQMPLVVRNRREGDRFQPLGMTGTKKLKTYFIDEKIPLRRRNFIPLLADRHSVIWISGMRLSERVKIDKKTSKIAKIEII